MGALAPEDFAQATLHAIAHDRPADPFPDREAETRDPTVIFEDDQSERGPAGPPSAAEDPLELSLAPQPRTRREGLPPRRGRGDHGEGAGSVTAPFDFDFASMRRCSATRSAAASGVIPSRRAVAKISFSAV